jgi:hypothetical protein
MMVAASLNVASGRAPAKVWIERLQQAHFAVAQVVGVVDERQRQPFAIRCCERRLFLEQTHGFGQRIYAGEATVTHEFVDVGAVEFRNDLGQIDLAPALAFQFGRSDEQRTAVVVLGCREQTRVGEIRRLAVERSRTAQRLRQHRLG